MRADCVKSVRPETLALWKWALQQGNRTSHDEPSVYITFHDDEIPNIRRGIVRLVADVRHACLIEIEFERASDGLVQKRYTGSLSVAAKFYKESKQMNLDGMKCFGKLVKKIIYSSKNWPKSNDEVVPCGLYAPGTSMRHAADSDDDDDDEANAKNNVVFDSLTKTTTTTKTLPRLQHGFNKNKNQADDDKDDSDNDNDDEDEDKCNDKNEDKDENEDEDNDDDIEDYTNDNNVEDDVEEFADDDNNDSVECSNFVAPKRRRLFGGCHDNGAHSGDSVIGGTGRKTTTTVPAPKKDLLHDVPPSLRNPPSSALPYTVLHFPREYDDDDDDDDDDTETLMR